MALKLIDHGSPEYEQMVQLRMDMLRKPLGLSFTPDELENEKNDTLIGLFEDERILGCCLLTEVSTGVVRLRQMAVPNNLQLKGVGRAILIFAENISRDMGYHTLMMHARVTATGFYEKLGYVRQEGEFMEVTVMHVVMTKKLKH